MTTIQAKKLLETIQKEVATRYANAKLAWEEHGDCDQQFLETTQIYSENIHDIDHEDIIKHIADFREDVKNLPYHIDGKESFAIKLDDDYRIVDYQLEYNYARFNTEARGAEMDTEASGANATFKQQLKKLLKPEEYKGFPRVIDCKLLKLYMDETIDWQTLQQLVYSDCRA